MPITHEGLASVHFSFSRPVPGSDLRVVGKIQVRPVCVSEFELGLDLKTQAGFFCAGRFSKPGPSNASGWDHPKAEKKTADTVVQTAPRPGSVVGLQ